MRFSSMDGAFRGGRSELKRAVVESALEEHEIQMRVQEQVGCGVAFVSGVKAQANLTGSFVYSTKVY